MVAVGMTSIAMVVAALTVALVGRAGRAVAMTAGVVVASLMVAEYSFASGGVLRDWTRRPPPLLGAAAVPILLALVTALSRVGGRIAIGTHSDQASRLTVEERARCTSLQLVGAAPELAGQLQQGADQGAGCRANEVDDVVRDLGVPSDERSWLAAVHSR